MPRYHFDILDIGWVDPDGIELPDINAVKKQAAMALAEAAKDLLPDDGLQKTFAIVVRNAAGQVVLKTSLSFLAEFPAEQAAS